MADTEPDRRPDDRPTGPTVETIEAFCRRVSPRLVGALTLQLGDRAAAEDVAQEALARAWQRWAQVSAMANPAGWVYRVAFNLALSRRRRGRAEQRANARSVTVETTESDSTDRLALDAAVRALPPRQRAAVVLRFYGQLSVAETADALGCAPGTVKALTSQGVHRLADLLEVQPDELERP